MDIFVAGETSNVVCPLNDALGNPLDYVSVVYRVLDNAGTEIVAPHAIAFIAGGATSVTIAVPATGNTLTGDNIREQRCIELTVTLNGGGTIIIKRYYGIESSEPLVVGLNSFMTLPMAELTARNIAMLPGWSNATDLQKIGALITARDHILQLNFVMLNSNMNWTQDSLNWVPEGSYETPYPNAFVFNGNLALLPPANFIQLPQRFLNSLYMGQIAEADFILGADPVAERRQSGLVLDTIGESKQMYRSGKPLDLPVCRQALSYMSQFITFSKRIGR